MLRAHVFSSLLVMTGVMEDFQLSLCPQCWRKPLKIELELNDLVGPGHMLARTGPARTVESCWVNIGGTPFEPLRLLSTKAVIHLSSDGFLYLWLRL